MQGAGTRLQAVLDVRCVEQISWAQGQVAQGPTTLSVSTHGPWVIAKRKLSQMVVWSSAELPKAHHRHQPGNRRQGYTTCTMPP